MNKKTILLILFFLSFLVRILLVNDGLYHHDSVRAAIATERTVEDLRLHPSVHGRYGYTLINALFYAIPYELFNAKSAEATITFVSILFGSLTVVVLYLLIKQLFNPYVALWSSLIFSFNPVYLSVTTYASTHGMSLFFVLASFYLLVRYLKDGKDPLLVIFFYLFSLTVRSDNIIYLPVFVILFLYPHLLGYFKYKHHNWFGAILLLLSVIPLVLSPAANTNEIDFALKPVLISITYLFMALTIPLSIMVLLSLAFSDKKTIILYLWFAFSFIPFIFVSVISYRFLLSAIIPLIVLFVYNISEKFKRVTTILSILLIIFMFVSIFPVLAFRNEYSSGKELGLFANILEDDSYIIIGDEAVFINYYSDVNTIVFSESSIPKIDKLLDTNNVYFLYCGNHKRLEFITSYFMIEHRFDLRLEDYHHSELDLKIRDCVVYEVVK